MDILRVADVGLDALVDLLGPRGMVVTAVPAGAPIPGSYWGEPEAGLLRNQLYLRPDTPVHSALHEAAHYLCMDPARQAILHRDAGGDYAEEDAVCYLQILLAEELGARIAATPGAPKLDRHRACADMDAWGYTFRLGSARAWFEQDAEDARAWLLRRGLLRDPM